MSERDLDAGDVFQRHPDIAEALWVDDNGPAFLPPWRDRDPLLDALIERRRDPHDEAARRRLDRQSPPELGEDGGEGDG